MWIRQKLESWKAYKLQLKQRDKRWYYAVDWSETIIVALIIALGLRQFVIQSSYVPTGSMIPTLMIGDRLFVNKFIYRFSEPERGDIVVFKSPHGDGKEFVKRLIGLPGDVVELRKGTVYINDERLVLPGVNVQRDYMFYGPQQVPTASYFFLGDNRANSQDSRFWGYVPRADILGKAMFTFYPLTRMRVLH